MKRLVPFLPEDVRASVLRSRVEDDVHGKDLTPRERALMMLESNDDEIQTFAKNQISQIDSAWIDSLREHNQTDCQEYKDFEAKLTNDAVKDTLYKYYLNPSPERVSEKKKSMLREKELVIVMKNVKKLKLFMRKYQDDPDLVEKIRHKLGSIIRDYYRRGGPFDFNGGAHPEYIMNSFIYNPWKDETRFKVLRIDGNQVTYQPYRNNEPYGTQIITDLDDFLKIPISAQTHSGIWSRIPIGEVYRFFPERDSDSHTDESYNANVNNYLENLMITFAKKPDTEFFSVPYIPPEKPKPAPKPKITPVQTKSNWVQDADGNWVKAPSGGRKTHHKRHNKKKKRTYKRRK